MWRDGIRNGLSHEQATFLVENAGELITFNANMELAQEYYGSNDAIPFAIKDAILKGYTPLVRGGKLYITNGTVDHFGVGEGDIVISKSWRDTGDFYKDVIVSDNGMIRADRVIDIYSRNGSTNNLAALSILQGTAKKLRLLSNTISELDDAYPGAVTASLTTFNIVLQTLVAGPAGTLNAVRAEALGHSLEALAEDQIAKIMTPIISKGASMIQSSFPLLSDEDAQTLAAAAIMFGGGAIAGAAATKVGNTFMGGKGGDLNNGGNSYNNPLSIIDNYIDLVGFRKDHILNRHRSGANKPDKTEFPSNWSDERIIHQISDIASDPSLNRVYTKHGSHVVGVRDGVEIRVNFYPDDHPTYPSQISTGFPIR